MEKELKLNSKGLSLQYYCNESGHIYFYWNTGEKEYLPYQPMTRSSAHKDIGISQQYQTVVVERIDGSLSQPINVADWIMRSILNLEVVGLTRMKDRDWMSTSISNLEFVEFDYTTGKPCRIHDHRGSISYNVFIDTPSKNSVLSQDMCEGPGETIAGPGNLVRDRSLLAKVFYTSIAEEGLSVDQATNLLVIPDSVNLLELYLEGGNIVNG